jgi:hypothetical protein
VTDLNPYSRDTQEDAYDKNIEASKEGDNVNVLLRSGSSTLAITFRPMKSHFKDVKKLSFPIII